MYCLLVRELSQNMSVTLLLSLHWHNDLSNHEWYTPIQKHQRYQTILLYNNYRHVYKKGIIDTHLFNTASILYI